MSVRAKIKRLLKIKIATAVFITVSFAAFATLGEGGKKGSSRPVSSTKAPAVKPFSLKTSHNYRAANLFSTPTPRYITLNTTVTYQKGNATYIVPLKKKVILDKVKFNPSISKF